MSFLEFNQGLADKFAKSTKGSIAVLGVRFEKVNGLSIKKG